MKRLFFFISILVLTSTTEARRSTEWSLNLDGKFDYIYFPESYGEETNQDLSRLELDPIYKWKYLDSWRFYVRPTFVADPNNKSEEERYFFDASEAYLRYQTETFSLQAGSNIFSWGVTDGYNPLDILNSKQYFDPLHSRKLGAPSIALSQAWDIWDYDLVYIPQNRGATMPGSHSRWLPRDVFVPQTPDNDLILLLPESLRYNYASRENLDHALDHNAAFRLQHHGSILDLSLSYYEGVASFPLVQPVVTGTVVQVSPKTVIRVDPDVTLNTKNYRLRQGGLSLVSNQWDFLFKYAGSYSQSMGDDPLLPGWTHENVLGLEKTFNIGTEGLLIAVLQHSFIFSEKENDSNLSVIEIFRNAWMLGGKMTWKEVWNFSFLGLYDVNHSSHFVEFSMGRRFLDQWVFSLTADLIAGSSDTPLGVYEKNDSYTLSLSRSF